MTEAEKGRHCAACNKVVRDFTHAAAEEILAEVAAKPGEICARVPRELVSPMALQGVGLASDYSIRRIRMFLLALVAVFGLEVFGVSVADAQNLKPVVDSLQRMEGIRLALDSLSKTDVIALGRVEDVYPREPLALVSVMAFDGNTFLAGTMTDDEGKFKLNFPKAQLASQTYDLKIQYLGRERIDKGISPESVNFVYLIDGALEIKPVTIFSPQQLYLTGVVLKMDHSSINHKSGYWNYHNQ